MAKRQSTASGSERVLPHDLAAEALILGAVLVHNDAYEAALKVLGSPGAMFRDAHRRLFAAMGRLLEAREGAVDLMTIRAELTRTGELDEVGGPAYISGLMDGIPRHANVGQYAAIVKEHAIRRALIFAANKTLSAAYAAETPAGDVLADADKALIELQRGNGHARMKTLHASSHDLRESLEYRCAHRGELSGVPTGFKSVDELTGGWQRGDLDVIGARPSIGKTSFVLNALAAAAQAGPFRAVLFSMEMRRQQLEYRMLSGLSGVPLARILGGFFLDAEWPKFAEALNAMDGWDIHIDDTSGRTAPAIRSECRRLKADGGLDLVVIDYVQLMQGTLERRGATRNEEITDISRRLKTTAEELDVPILLLSQLSRAGEGRRPILSDLRESGALEQDADLVIFLHRKNHRESGTTNLIIEKARNSATGTVNLSFDRDLCLFTDGGEDVPEPPPSDTEKAERQRKAIIGRRMRRR